MKKLLIICIGILLCTTGCSLSEEQLDGVVRTQDNITSYEYVGTTTFVPVSYQCIKDGTFNGLTIIQYVNLDNGVMYVYTEKYNEGYATTWCELKNADGTLMVYEKLDELRETYNWSKKN